MKTILIYKKTMDSTINMARSIMAIDRKNRYAKWIRDNQIEGARVIDNVVEFDNEEDATLFILVFGNLNVPRF